MSDSGGNEEKTYIISGIGGITGKYDECKNIEKEVRCSVRLARRRRLNRFGRGVGSTESEGYSSVGKKRRCARGVYAEVCGNACIVGAP